MTSSLVAGSFCRLRLAPLQPPRLGHDWMNKKLTFFAAAFFATAAMSIAISESEALVDREKAVWNAFRDKKVNELKKLVSTDVSAVYPDGIYNFQQRLDGMSKMTMTSFAVGNFNVSMLSADLAMISYKAKVKNADGSSSELNCGTVWKMQNGEWKAIFHADMPAGPPAK